MRLYRKGEDPATFALTVVAVITMAVSLIVMLVAHKPDVRVTERKAKARQFQIRLLNDKARDNIKARQTSIAAQTWNLPEQQVGPTALASVTRLVARRGLKVVSFRPQRRNDEGQFVQLPYLLTVDGSYPAVLSLCRDLEQPTNKLAVSLVQVAAADAASDRVTASIGLVAYMTPMEKKTSG